MSAKRNREIEYRPIWEEARIAANKAGAEAKPTPMVVGMAVGFSNEIVPGTEEVVEDGVCGFAWINTPGTGSFAGFLKDNDYASKSVYKGYDIWSSALYDYYGQSMERKEAAMRAAVEVFQKYGIKCYMSSRMD